MEKIKICFLGTSGSVPQKNKNFASTIISFSGNNLLFDCPEGTQRQLMISNNSLMRINNVFISHLHGDHFLGLFGWIATMTLNQRKEKLTIFSPKGGRQKIIRILKETIKPCFEIEFKEIKRGLLLKNNFFEIRAFPLKHEIACYGFVFKEKDKEGKFDRKKAEKLGIPAGPLYSKLVSGKIVTINGKKFCKKDVFDYSKKRVGRKIVVISDTRPLKESITNGKNADIMIHESTHLEEQKERAIESFHSTAKEAAEIAKKACVKKLFLFHYSARNNDEKEFEKEARIVFKESFCVKDFDEIEI